MKVKLVNNDGSGSIADESPISYSYSEDVTSLEPSTLNGGSGQISVSAVAVEGPKSNNKHIDSKYLINNNMTLSHEDGGNVKFRVTQASVNAGVVSLTGATLQSRLNVERVAAPHGGAGYTLYTAIVYYCGLVDISTSNGNLFFEGTLASQLDTIPVNFIGWKGNVWEHLKMLCSAVSISTSDNVGVEFYVDSQGLHFRQAKTTFANYLDDRISSQSINIENLDSAQEVKVISYNTSYKTNSIVQDVANNRANVIASAANSTTYDSMQVNAGETLTKRFTINASLETVNQPVPVDRILPFPYTGGQGQYCISGADGLFIKATQWTGTGGKLSVRLTENPNEIEITITAPADSGLENINGGGALSYEPYKVGVETSGLADYPAIYITGTGVFYDKQEYTLKTGASSLYTAQTTAPTIDNPFITGMGQVYSKGAAASQVICGPNVTLNETYDSIEPFNTTPGLLRKVDGNIYRITSVNYSADGTSIVGKPAATFSDFNAIWPAGTTGKFSDFNSYALDPATYPNEAMKFNEFTVTPLLRS